MIRVGAWLIGARGAVACTVVVGARAIAHGLSTAGGLVTELPEVARLPLVGLEQLVFGGWEVAGGTLLDRARELAHEHRSLPEGLVAALEDDLLAADSRVCPGFLDGAGPAAMALASRSARRRREPIRAAIGRLGQDLEGFRSAHRLETVVVVNLASTEAPLAPRPEHDSPEHLERLIDQDRREALTPSMVYAYAALSRGFPFLNFTPSAGVAPPALQELGRRQGLPFYGRDGKTGETLVKSALAPLFRTRNLEVLAWHGVNLLGGGDGRVLDDPLHKQAKLRSKAGPLQAMLGYRPQTKVLIEYAPSLGTWKTAWDHIHFRGFLGTKMTMQFIWHGCDSVLAAPLVLDLIRLTEFAHRRREAGPMCHLACFFKDPLGVEAHALAEQFQMLRDYVERHAAAAGAGGR